MNLVVITRDQSPYGLRVLNGLLRAGLQPRLTLVQRQSLSRNWKLLKSVARRNGWFDALGAAIQKRRDDAEWSREVTWRGAPLVRDYLALSADVLRADNCHEPGVLSRLDQVSPDLIVLAQSGIVRTSLIARARLGVVNAHPGLLPDYRGIEPALWALHDGAAECLGSSLHFVDAGIDTGPIISVRRFVPPQGLAFEELERALYEDCVDVIVAACETLAQGGTLRGEPQDGTRGRQCFKMSRRDTRIARQRYTELCSRLSSDAAPDSLA